MAVRPRRFTLLFALVILAASCSGSGDGGDENAESVPSRSVPAWLTARASTQRTAAAGATVLHDFAFADLLDSSGITFRNQFVDWTDSAGHRVNLGGQRFREATGAAFGPTSWGAMGLEAFDWNGDERVDQWVDIVVR